MNTAVNIAEFRRRRRHALGDDVSVDAGGIYPSTAAAGGPGPDTIEVPLPQSIPEIQLPPQSGTVSVTTLQQETAAGQFNNLKTPWPYYGVPGSNVDPYAANQATAPSLTPGEPFQFFGPSSSPDQGGGGAPPVRIGASPGLLAGQTATQPVASSSGVLSSVQGWLGTPLYTGSPITWGWALVIAGLAWWLMYRE